MLAADAAVASLPGRFAEAAAAIATDEHQLQNCQLEAEGEAAGLEQARQEAIADQQAAAAAVAAAVLHLEAAAAAAAAVGKEAAKYSEQSAAAQRAAQKLKELRQAEEVVQQQLAAAEEAAAEVQRRIREVSGQRAKLQHELGLAEAAAAASRWAQVDGLGACCLPTSQKSQVGKRVCHVLAFAW